MDFTEILRSAYRHVEAAELPASLQPAAFAKTIDHLVRQAGVQPHQHNIKTNGTPIKAGSVSEVDALANLEQRLAIPAAELAEVYYLDGEELRLSLRPADFGSAMWSGAQKVTLLALAGRQGSEIEAVTPQSAVRQFVEQMKKYDPKNFASAISAMKDQVTVRGTGPNRGLVLKARGFDEAAAFIRSLSGDSE